MHKKITQHTSCVKKFKSTSTNSCMRWWFQRFLEFSAKISNWVETNHQPVFLDEKSSTCRQESDGKSADGVNFDDDRKMIVVLLGVTRLNHRKTERRQETYPAAVFKTNMSWAADNQIF